MLTHLRAPVKQCTLTVQRDDCLKAIVDSMAEHENMQKITNQYRFQ